jgi:hypothetical protein
MGYIAECLTEEEKCFVTQSVRFEPRRSLSWMKSSGSNTFLLSQEFMLVLQVEPKLIIKIL